MAPTAHHLNSIEYAPQKITIRKMSTRSATIKLILVRALCVTIPPEALRMNVFDTHAKIVADYASYIRSFINIADPAISKKVDSALSEGKLWPDPDRKSTRLNSSH